VKVFVAGATGAIGRPLVPKLIEAGHEVTGMTRSEDKAAGLREAGAKAVVCDVFDEPAVREAITAASSEVVVHQLTALPERYDPRDPELYKETNRLRAEGGRILIDAAREAGARRMVAQSIAFMYAPAEGPATEDDPLLEAPGHFGEGVKATRQMEQAVTGTEGLEGLVLRYGFFYGPGTYYGPGGSSEEDVRRRRQPVVGSGAGVFSFVHIDGAADATVAACERGAPGIYNVVDDEPTPMREWLPAYAEAIGAKKPFRVPAFLARLVAGKDVVAMATTIRGASNAKAKRELGWQPGHPSWRQGFRESAGG
jgi:nucleoside-diphosphate-sugar epimerase